MKSVEFCYWLQGFFECAEPDALTPRQVETIKKHLALVFVHEIDPSYPKEQQAALNETHAGPAKPISGHGPGGITYRC